MFGRGFDSPQLHQSIFETRYYSGFRRFYHLEVTIYAEVRKRSSVGFAAGISCGEELIHFARALKCSSPHFVLLIPLILSGGCSYEPVAAAPSTG